MGTRYKSLKKLIAFQTLVCTLLFIIIFIAKAVNISAANYLTAQIRHVLDHNIEIKSVLSNVKNLAADIHGSIVSKTDEGKAAKIDLHSDTVPGSSHTPTLSNSMEEFTEAAEPVGKSVLSASSHSAVLPDMIAPVEGTLVTPFGEINPNTAFAKVHAGIDICVEKQGIVKAALEGEVAETGSSPEYGSYIRIRHDNGLETVYAHGCIPIVDEGDVVNRGDAIAQVGDKNISGGQHLHFEVWKEGEAVNPLEYISVDAR